MIYPSKMVIFHSYVNLPEGTYSLQFFIPQRFAGGVAFSN